MSQLDEAGKFIKDNGKTIGVSLGGSILGSSVLGFFGLPLVGAIAGAIAAPILIKKLIN